MEKRLGYVCSYCGSGAILLDAWAEWESDRQEWVLHDTLQQAYCRACDGETHLLEVELKPEPQD